VHTQVQKPLWRRLQPRQRLRTRQPSERELRARHHYNGEDFKVEDPTGSGHYLTLEPVGDTIELAKGLSRTFLKDAAGNRSVLRQYPELQTDPHYQDCIPFYEYFDGDNGRGAGASHQTGWTGLIAKLLIPTAGEQASDQVDASNNRSAGTAVTACEVISMVE
jgi:hypothetical protein